jgi:AcrR family transcriptional regulator
MKKGSFYYFFESKPQLTAEALKHHWESLRPMYDPIFSSTVESALRDAQALFAYVDGLLGQARIQNDLELIRTLPEGVRRFLALEPAAV